MKKKKIQEAFVESGMIDKETHMVPTFDGIMRTCKRWVSTSQDIGIPKSVKEHCKKQFQPLMKKQLENGQITYPDMKEAGIPLGKFE